MINNHTQKKLIVNIGIFMLSISITNVYATNYPKGCEVRGFGFDNGHLIVNENSEQTLYLIKNHSDNTIMLEHYEAEETFLSPKLRNKMSRGAWSAFASDIKNQHFKCFNINANEKLETDCSSILEICQYPRVKFALSNMGTYWVSVNKPQPQVIKDAIAKGILLHW